MANLPDIDSLRCFVEAARLLNFRAASAAVGLTPAALGQRIRKLEDQLDVSLFQRTTRKVVLTEAGMAMLPVALRTLSEAEACVRAARGEGGPIERDIVIGTRHELGLSWIIPMLPQLRDAFSGVTFHLYVGSGPDLDLRVRSGEVDCAVSSRRVTDPVIDFYRLHPEEYAFVGSPQLLAERPIEHPEDAAHHTLVDTSGEVALFRYWRDAPGGHDSLEFGKLLQMGTIAIIREMIVTGQGVGVLPLYLVQRDLDEGRLQRILPEVEPRHDWFRLLFRKDDPRRLLFQGIAREMAATPLA